MSKAKKVKFIQIYNVNDALKYTTERTAAIKLNQTANAGRLEVFALRNARPFTPCIHKFGIFLVFELNPFHFHAFD